MNGGRGEGRGRKVGEEDEMESGKRKRVRSLRLCGGIQRRSAGGDVGLFQRQRRLLPSLFSSSPSGSYSNNYKIRTKVTYQILKTAYPLSPLCRRPAAAHFAATPHSAALSRRCPLFPNLVVLGASMFWTSDSMYSNAFDVLIKIWKAYRS